MSVGPRLRSVSVETTVDGLGRAVAGTLRAVVWAVLTVTVLLSSWVAFGWWVGGWTPVTITSGSMEPALSVGDVLLIADDDLDGFGQRSIVVFERDDTLVAHRVFAVEGDVLTTKGDANASPDVQPVASEDVVGVGRLVVPFIGRPIVWAMNGAWPWFVVWLGLLSAGIGQLVLAAQRALRRLAAREQVAPSSLRHEVGRRGIQRVRSVVAVLIATQYFVGRDLGSGLEVGQGTVAVFAIGVLSATNLLGAIAQRWEHSRARVVALAELGIDTVLVVVLAMATGGGGSTWVLLSLPIIEAAVRFRLVGALVHWMLLTTVIAVAKIWEGGNDPSALLLGDLDRVIDQLSVLFLVVIPAAFLAEQLIGEVSTWQDATGVAENRGQLLVRVAELSREISRLNGANVDMILEGVRSLGFDRCDMVVDEGVRWRVARGDELPAPGSPASCVAPGQTTGTFVDLTDPDDDEVEALHAAGLSAVVSQFVSVRDGRPVMLRAALDSGRSLGPGLVEAFGLLAGQASVALRNDELLAELTTVHSELEHQATHDALTGLANRVLFLRRLEELMAPGSAAPVGEHAVMFLDLNGFKPINDRLGHDAGDVVLQRVAERLRDLAPARATVARLGGDEFTLLIPEATDRDLVVSTAKSIINEMRRPLDLAQGQVSVDTAIGISFGGQAVGAAEMIRRADVAMYEAKHRGVPGQLYELYRPEFDSVAKRRDRLVGDVQAAILAGDIQLVYQPIYDIVGVPTLVGAEAHVTWQHPAVGAVAAREIIESARVAGCMRDLTVSVLDAACQMAARWSASASTHRCFVAVNAAIDEISDASYPTLVRGALNAGGLTPDLLCVEVDEEALASPLDAVRRNVSELQQMGVQLVLDDVGHDTLSISSVSTMPLSAVKLAREAVLNAMRSETDRVVLASVVDLCRRLGQDVIAGGIESDEQLRMVRVAGTTLAQGFYLGVPQPGGRIIQLAASPTSVQLGSDPTEGAPVFQPPTVPTLPPPPTRGAQRSDAGRVVR